jgi:tetratricopeptide (TPR) repeat protein
VPKFVGRAGELATLTAMHDDPATRTVIISAIAGTAGVGKTALAVQWGHQVRRQFPDGQLYVNLRGYDPGEPLTPAEALAGFMRALGVAARDIPAATEERTAQYRSLLADRRMLILLDNAQSAEQVRPLLPGTPTCAVLVTSRDALTGLVARDGARRLDLDLLPPGEAVALLRTLIGQRAVDSPEATHALAAHCARLPLALRIAAELVASRPSAPLSELVGELTDTERRLDLLDAGGDDGTAIRAVFSWSYRHLPAKAARAFRLLGLHPTADFDLYAAAALTGAATVQAQHLIELLARAHLIQPLSPGWFTMHDLLRAYAAEVAAWHDAELDRTQALTRLFDYYLRAASDAMDTLFPAERAQRPVVPDAVSDVPSVSEPGSAKAWLDAHRDILAAAAANMAAGWPGQADLLIAVLVRYLDDGGYFDHLAAGYRYAYRSARHRGDHAAESQALTGLGGSEWRLGQYADAKHHLEQALALYRQTGDRPGEGRALGNLGNVLSQQGHYEEAAGFYRQALNLFRKIDHLMGQGVSIGSLGDIDGRQGRYAQSESRYQQALKLFRQLGNRTFEAYALNGLGEAVLWQGRYAEAGSHLQQALDLARQTGNRSCEPYVLAHLGELHLRLGRPQLAASHHRQALERFRDIGDRSGEAQALSGLGDVLLATEQPQLALAEHDAALKLATLIGYRHQMARAHDGLARAHLAVGDPASARENWQLALDLYADLGTPEANQVRAHLASIGDFRRQSATALDPSEITDLFSHVLT